MRPSGALITASATVSVRASTPNCFAAPSTSSPRTCAAAFSNAEPLSAIVWLPAVRPSSGDAPVSAVRNVISEGFMFSSSAATCSSAVRTPVPSSTLPVNTVTLPSGVILIHASSSGLVFRLPASVSVALATWTAAPSSAITSCAAARVTGARLNATKSAPETMKCRRLSSMSSGGFIRVPC